MIRILTPFIVLLFVTNAWAQNATPSPTPPSPGPAKPFIYKPLPSDIVTGKEDAPVVIVEYASLTCPHCSHFYMHVLPDLTTKYIDSGKVKLVYRHYPLNAPALSAAELVQCADKDRRHAFIKVLFSTQMKWAYDANYKESLAGIAGLGGMSREAFDACMENKSVEKSILEIAKQAQDDYKVNSTPTFFINGKNYEGDQGTDPMSKAIDGALFVATKK